MVSVTTTLVRYPPSAYRRCCYHNGDLHLQRRTAIVHLGCLGDCHMTATCAVAVSPLVGGDYGRAASLWPTNLISFYRLPLARYYQ